MSFIFLDESGDLGFSKVGSSEYFIVTILFTSQKRPIEKVVRKVHRMLKKKYKGMSGILHSVREKPTTRKRLLSLLAKKDIKIMLIFLNKKKVYTKLQNQKNVLYNYVTNILLDRICTRKLIPVDKTITLIASRKETNKFLNLNFKSYLSSQVNANHKIKLDVEIKTPHQEKTLQAVDFISWALFRKYELKDDSYYKIIKDKILEEKSLF